MQVGFKVSCYCASGFVATTNQDSSFVSRQFDTTEEYQDFVIFLAHWPVHDNNDISIIAGRR